MMYDCIISSLQLTAWGPDIIDLQYHLDKLRGQTDLLLLTNQSLDDILLLHI